MNFPVWVMAITGPSIPQTRPHGPLHRQGVDRRHVAGSDHEGRTAALWSLAKPSTSHAPNVPSDFRRRRLQAET